MNFDMNLVAVFLLLIYGCAVARSESILSDSKQPKNVPKPSASTSWKLEIKNPVLDSMNKKLDEINGKLDLILPNIAGLKPALRFKGSNTQDYVITSGAPAMKAITVCLWIKTTQKVHRAHYVSYAVTGSDNEFLLYSDEKLNFYLGGSSSSIKSPGIKIKDGKWHHICVTWKSQEGAYQVYKDGTIAGHGRIAAGRGIQGGGTWVLGQDQDNVGGGFDPTQAMQGELAYCNVWSYVLPSTEILEMSKSCKGFIKGNVKTWDNFLCGIRGNVESIKATCC